MADKKIVTLYSPWGSKVTTDADNADALKESGFTSTKPAAPTGDSDAK